jgi:hypothetical protein
LNITSHNWLENWVLKIAKYCFYQYAAHPKNTTFFSNIKVMIDELLQDAAQMKLYVLSAMYLTAELRTAL